MSTDPTAINPPDETAAHSSAPVVAKAGTYYRRTRYLMTVILVGYGLWSAYDGFYNWPRWKYTHPKEKEYNAASIFLNQALGVLLPPLGIFVLVQSLRNSRGEYRLQDDVLHVPGHPPVPLDHIQAVDRRLWDRKGIAYIEYEVPGSAPGKLKLDDFVYDRKPTDRIFARVEAAILKDSAQPPVEPETDA